MAFLKMENKLRIKIFNFSQLFNVIVGNRYKQLDEIES
jgi:hypothetical protein